MIRGKVTDQVWCTRHIKSLPKGALLEVEVAGSKLIAFDPLGCAKGEEVLITQGSVAAGHFEVKTPVDALIIGSVDQPTAGNP